MPTTKAAAPRPLHLDWKYSFAEVCADALVHAVGLTLGIVGAIVLVAWAAGQVDPAEFAGLLIYAAALLAMLAASAAYNLWPVSPTKWVLRRLDHSAIYLLIAGTYTPLMLQLKGSHEGWLVLLIVWVTALAGIALKLALPGRFDRASIVVYLLLSWCVVGVYDLVSAALSESALAMLLAGGLLYSAGVAFHVWRSLPYQNAIWHAFVVAAAGCHWLAVVDSVVLA